MSLEFCEGRIIYPSKHAAERELLAAARRKSRLPYLDGIAVERDVRPCTACNGWHVIETTTTWIGEVVRFVKWPYAYEALVAEIENDKDVAGGALVSGPELDWIEAGFREHQRDMDRAFLFGSTA